MWLDCKQWRHKCCFVPCSEVENLSSDAEFYFWCKKVNSKQVQSVQHSVNQNCPIAKGEEIKSRIQMKIFLVLISEGKVSYDFLSPLPLPCNLQAPPPCMKKTVANFCIRFLSTLHLFIITFQKQNFNFFSPSVLF